MLWICVILMTILAVYAVGYYVSIFVFLLARAQVRSFNDAREDDVQASDARVRNEVAILVPAREEGARAIRIIRSLLQQDYPGPIEILLLLKNEADSAIPFLKDAFPQQGDLLVDEPNRRVTVVFTGETSKSAKINHVAQGLTAPFAAIIDCDHQAHPAWVRSSLQLLREQGARFIQGRRGPLSARGLFRLWDSLHQHIGCELFNTAFARMGLTVFFTGTTAILETKLLQEHPLHACITEDADFSYQVVLKGVKIIHNPWYGSDEEVSPDLYSFLARRRRWSNGHTATFFRHVPRVWNSPLSWAERLQFFYHGFHYLIAPIVAVLHLFIGLYFMTHMFAIHVVAALMSALFLAIRFSASQKSRSTATRFSEIAVVFAWFFPALLIGVNLLLAILAHDAPRAVLPIPFAFQILGLVCFSAPLIALLVGLAGYRQLSVGTFFAVTLTYPVAFYLDIAGVLIGLTDLMAGWSPWHAVTRSEIRAPTSDPAHALTNQKGPGDHPPAVPFAMQAAIDIRKSWSWRKPGDLLLSMFVSDSVDSTAPISHTRKSHLMKSFRWIPVAFLVVFVIGTIMYTPPTNIAIQSGGCVAREHDTHPWIVGPERFSGYCEASGSSDSFGGSFGTFPLARTDDFRTVDSAFWDRLDSTFHCNLARFRPANVSTAGAGELQFALQAGDFGDRKYASGSIATKDRPEAQYLYGRFEVVMKPARVSGVVTAFFLYRFDPWQEIDMEFLGNDTTKLLLNVFYNPGEEGDKYNYGFRGTPVVVELGFDAAEDFHRYAVEWDPDEIRWFVDDRLLHRRRAGRPTPIPHLPMRFHLNLWPTCSEELAGPFNASALPAKAKFRSLKIYGYEPAAFPAYSRWIDSLVSWEAELKSWRDKANWIQPSR